MIKFTLSNIYFAIILLDPTAAFAQSKIYIPPDIDLAHSNQSYLYKNKQPYVLLRYKLIREGWKPIIRYDIMSDRDIYGSELEINSLIDAGFDEVQNCTGADITNCVFKFTRGDYCLSIRTVGEYMKKERSPVVFSKELKRCRSKLKG